MIQRPRGGGVLLAAVLLATLPGCSVVDDGAAPSSPTRDASASEDWSSAADPGRPTEPLPAEFFGMHDGRITQGLTPDAPVGSLRLWDAGTSWLHLETAPGEFAWDALDAAVAAAEARDARPLLVLGQTPAFHASKPRQEAAYGPGAASMPDLEAWTTYVTAVAERYGDRLDYQVWNEANIIGYWTGTPEEMATLTLEAAQAIREVAPEATVIGPAFALRLPSQQRDYTAFWSLPEAGEVADALDAAAVHLYPPGEDAPETQVELYDVATGVFDDQGIELPIWDTEIGFGLLGGAEPPPIPESTQQAYVLRGVLLNAGLGLERMYWYRWDSAPIANTLLSEAPSFDTPTSAGVAFGTAREWLEGVSMTGCEQADAVWRCEGSIDGETRTWWWRTDDGSESVRIPRASQRWETADGETYECDVRCRVPVGETPVMVVSDQPAG